MSNSIGPTTSKIIFMQFDPPFSWQSLCLVCVNVKQENIIAMAIIKDIGSIRIVRWCRKLQLSSTYEMMDMSPTYQVFLLFPVQTNCPTIMFCISYKQQSCNYWSSSCGLGLFLKRFWVECRIIIDAMMISLKRRDVSEVNFWEEQAIPIKSHINFIT